MNDCEDMAHSPSDESVLLAGSVIVGKDSILKICSKCRCVYAEVK